MKPTASRHPSSLCRKIRVALLARCTNVGLMTVYRRLCNEFGRKSNKTAHKPHLTTAMKLKRSDFAKKYEDWTAEQRGMAMFSIESLVQQFVVHMWHTKRPPWKGFYEKYGIPTTKLPPS